MRVIIIGLLALFLAACESNPPAPVEDRSPSTKPAPPTAKPVETKPAVTPTQSPAQSPTPSKDWRPDSYIVKKGDTLYSIGLEFGYDYREIAEANQMSEPYPLQIGQKLNFASLNNKNAAVETKPLTTQSDDAVVVSPIKTEPAGTATSNEVKPAASQATPVLSEPRATREPYSAEALKRATPAKASDVKIVETKPVETKPTETKPVEAKPTETKPAETKPTETKPMDDEALTWARPTAGKVIGNFSEASNKGLDIAGSAGQAVNAAAGGKVIYTGADLRGYGKLVIIKHNKTFLSVYAHNSKILVKEGQAVSLGQKIAEMGNTDTNAVKLHFEIRRQGKSVDPAKYLPQN